MKKKCLFVLTILILALTLSSCSVIPASTLEAMFRTDEYTASSLSSMQGDTVMISREEYEKYKQFSEMFDIFDAANESFYVETNKEQMIEYATRGLMAGLDDPYSFYYSPKEYEELWEEDEGKYVGIGVMIQANMETQECTIIRVFEGGPAQEAGVRRGDILYRVGEDLYVNATNLQDAVDIMRGEPETNVDVTFLRDNEEITFTITRRQVNVNQVESQMLDRRTGYIALYEFAGHCDEEFEKALNTLVSQGAEGIIIDLRDNSGGWVDQARYIADLVM